MPEATRQPQPNCTRSPSGPRVRASSTASPPPRCRSRRAWSRRARRWWCWVPSGAGD